MTAEEIVRAREATLRFQRPLETVFVVDRRGNVILEKTSETEYEVSFTEEEIAAIRTANGAILTHNHPRGWNYLPEDPRHAGYSFSPQDVRLACRAELAEIRAVGPRYVYSMKPPQEGWNEDFWRIVEMVYEVEKEAVDHELQRNVFEGLISREEYRTVFLHHVWVRVANLLGLSYNRVEEG